MFCPFCGAQINDDLQFCPSCGARNVLAAAPKPPAEKPDEKTVGFGMKPAEEAVKFAESASEGFAPERTAPEPAAESFTPEPAAASVAPEPAELPFTPEPFEPEDPSDYTSAAFSPSAAPEAPAEDRPAAEEPQAFVQTAWSASAPEEPEPVAEKKRSMLKPLLLGLGGVAVLALLIFGLVKLLGSRSKQNELFRVAENSVEELKDYLGELPNLNQMIRISDEVNQEKRTEGSISAQYRIEEVSLALSAEMKSDLVGKKAMADMKLNVDQLSAPVELGFYVDEEALTFASATLLKENEAISFPLKDLGKQWNSSALAELTDTKLPEELSLSLFQQASLEDILTAVYGEQWTSFEDSIKLVDYEGTSRFSDGAVKTVTWDRELLKPMYEQAKKDVENLEDLEDLEDQIPGLAARTPAVRQTASIPMAEGLMQLDVRRYVASFVVYAFGQFDENKVQVQLRLDKKEAVTGFFAQHEDEFIELRLQGEKNPWERITVLAGEIWEDGTETAQGGEARLQIENDRLSMEILSLERESGQPDAYEKLEGMLVYDDKSGRISVLDDEGGDQLEQQGVSFIAKPEDGRICLHLEIDLSNIVFTGRDGDQFSMDVRFGPLSGSVQKPEYEVRNLMELSKGQLQGLLMRMASKVVELLPEGIIE